MQPSVCIESSIVSYLAGRPSRDAIMAGRQRETRRWWEIRRGEYELFSSRFVLREVFRGEPAMARTRAVLLKEVQLLRTRPAVNVLARALFTEGPLPPRARSDAVHIAMAAVNGLDFLLTWNCKHIATRGCTHRSRGFAGTVGTRRRSCAPRRHS